MQNKTFLIFLILVCFNISLGQQIDTLKVIVLSPNEIEISKDCQEYYNSLKKIALEKRTNIKSQKLKEKNSDLESYNKMPDYSKMMFENELSFYDSLTVDNYVSVIVREYIAYRLYKPFKIKPRKVLVSLKKSISEISKYSEITKNEKNVFIINFPKIKFYKENGNFRVKTTIELYSKKLNEIVLSKEEVGIPKSGLTDYPMCFGDNWDCAIVNSVYPSLYDILNSLVEYNDDKQ